MSVEELLERIDGDATAEELEELETVESAERLNREEASERLLGHVEEHPTSDVISVNHPELAPAVFEATSVAKSEIERLVDDYGLPTAILEIPVDPEPDVKHVDRVYHEIGRQLPSGLLMLSNDEYIRRNINHLERTGFDFVDDWEAEYSDYRKLLELAGEIGTTYSMVMDGRNWSYLEE